MGLTGWWKQQKLIQSINCSSDVSPKVLKTDTTESTVTFTIAQFCRIIPENQISSDPVSELESRDSASRRNWRCDECWDSILWQRWQKDAQTSWLMDSSWTLELENSHQKPLAQDQSKMNFRNTCPEIKMTPSSEIDTHHIWTNAETGEIWVSLISFSWDKETLFTCFISQ